MAARERNVLGGELEACGTDPLTGFYRVGNDLVTPRPEWRFPGLTPGDRWCVVASRWLEAHQDGAAAPVFLAATHERALEIVPLQLLQSYAADVPDDPSSLL